MAAETKEFDAAVLLSGDAIDHPCQHVEGFSPGARSLELIRLGCVVPQQASGYVDLLTRGSTRAVRLDCLRQLAKYVRFTIEPRTIDL